MTFGDQTVGFVVVTLGDPDANGVRARTRSTVSVAGCHFRPLRVEEKSGVFNIASEVWKCTAPVEDVVVSAASIDELLYGGETFQVVGGAQPSNDFTAEVFKVTVLAERKKG